MCGWYNGTNILLREISCWRQIRDIAFFWLNFKIFSNQVSILHLLRDLHSIESCINLFFHIFSFVHYVFLYFAQAYLSISIVLLHLCQNFSLFSFKRLNYKVHVWFYFLLIRTKRNKRRSFIGIKWKLLDCLVSKLSWLLGLPFRRMASLGLVLFENLTVFVLPSETYFRALFLVFW